jgi:hypothetical protein
VADWTALIESYASTLEGEDTKRPHRPVGHGGNTSGTSSNGGVRATGSSGPKFGVDEIIAELDALSIRQEELRSMLHDAQLSEDGSARTSPFQNTAHLVIQTPLSELSESSERSESESSRPGQGQRRGSPSSHNGWKRVFGRGKHANYAN